MCTWHSFIDDPRKIFSFVAEHWFKVVLSWRVKLWKLSSTYGVTSLGTCSSRLSVYSTFSLRVPVTFHLCVIKKVEEIIKWRQKRWKSNGTVLHYLQLLTPGIRLLTCKRANVSRASRRNFNFSSREKRERSLIFGWRIVNMADSRKSTDTLQLLLTYQTETMPDGLWFALTHSAP